ncbi:alpha/beta fold hydrolase [Coxiella endosymbiont of Amblyomma sculptum]|uniref:alpha/beta fold hydrolase n=1 Tax=Coxiella endosymbiont of Amblyomma sculptum TaxID=2487929 RepID=UPI001C550059|nr:alpha/beta fold hydrolase [Coxiella endosymbiont of Amblyomma sculptum]
MAFISGWGFKSSLLKGSILYLREFLLIDLPDIKKLTLDKATRNVSHLIPNNTTVIGWSLGGVIGILLAAYFPKKVKKLVLLSSSPCFTQKQGWKGISSTEIRKFVDLAENDFVSLFNYFLALVNYPNKKIYYKRLLIDNSLNFLEHRDLLFRYLKILFRSDIREAYSKIQIPVFHVFGNQDPIVGLNLKKIRDLNPRVVVHIVPKSGHLSFLTHEKSYYNRLVEFISYA